MQKFLVFYFQFHNSDMEEQNRWSFVNALHKKYSNDEPLRIFIHIPKGAPGKEGRPTL